MTKQELLDMVCEKTGASKKATEEFLEQFVKALEKGLLADGKVQIGGFGNFEVRERAAREGINPKTGAKIKIAASKAPGFKPAKAFKDKFNKKHGHGK